MKDEWSNDPTILNCCLFISKILDCRFGRYNILSFHILLGKHPYKRPISKNQMVNTVKYALFTNLLPFCNQNIMMQEIWPEHLRPKYMRKAAFIAETPMEEILAYYKLQKESEKAEKDEGDASGLREGKHPRIMFKEQEDDRRSKFHTASFLRLPLAAHKKWFKKMPIKRTPFVKNMGLEFTGSQNKLTDVTIKKLHSRTKPLEMKHFFAGNLNVTNKKTEVRKVQDGSVETTFDFAWTNPASVGGIQEALINYACAIHPLWPQDPTALIMFRVLITYKWLVHVWENKRVSIMLAFFQDVLRQNAGRAANREQPLDYGEQEDVLKSLLRANNFRPDIPLDDNKPKYNNTWKDRQSFGNSARKDGNPVKREKAVYKGKNGTMGVCYGYNDESGARPCNNVLQKSGDHCRNKDGVSFAHVCNVFLPAKNTWCLARHPRKDHK